MCKLCEAVEQASRIDNMNADTSLKLARASQLLNEGNRTAESRDLAKAAVAYWNAPKEAAAEELAPKPQYPEGDQPKGSGQVGDAGVAAPTKGWFIDNTTGELHMNGVFIGELTIVDLPLVGPSVAIKPARHKH